MTGSLTPSTRAAVDQLAAQLRELQPDLFTCTQAGGCDYHRGVAAGVFTLAEHAGEFAAMYAREQQLDRQALILAGSLGSIYVAWLELLEQFTG